MKFLVVALAVLATLALAEDEVKVEEEEGVLVVTDANFQHVLEKYQNVLVEFYAPWCGHCKSLAPIYVETAKALKDQKSPVTLAKVDATENKEVGEKYDIRGFPTLRFFKNGNADMPIEYSSDRTKEAMMKFIEKKMEPAVHEISHSHHLTALRKKSDALVLGFFKDEESDSFKAFKNVAEGMDDAVFARVTHDSLRKELYISEDQDTIVLAKTFDAGRADMTEDFTEEKISEFITLNSLPRVIEFTQETANQIFGQDTLKIHCLLFVAGDSKKGDAITTAFGDVATDMRLKPGNEMLFVSVNTDVASHEKVMEFFGVNKDQLPTMRIVDLNDASIPKYKPVFAANNLDQFAIRTFIDGYYGGKLEKYFKSADLPEDWDSKPVKELVQSNFDKFIEEHKDDSVFVMFYAPWCGHCKQMIPTWEELAETHKDGGVMITKVDGTANEIPRHEVRGFPTIYYFAKGHTESVQYQGERSIADLEEFIKYDGSPPAKVEESDEEDAEIEDVKKDEL